MGENLQDIIKRMGDPDTYELAKAELIDILKQSKAEHERLQARVNTLSEQNSKLALRVGGLQPEPKEEKTEEEKEAEEMARIKEDLKEALLGE